MYSLNFRVLTQNDMNLLERWYDRTEYFGYATGFKSFSEVRQRLTEEHMIPDKIVCMIDINGKTTGFTFAEIINLEGIPVLWIYILIILPEYQNQGYGSCVVDNLINYAKTKYDSLTCIVAVSTDNKQGVSFWEKAGYTRSHSLEKTLIQNDVAIFKQNI